MIIEKKINNNVIGFRILDQDKEYFLKVEDVDLNKTEAEQKEIALVVYNAIKLKEAQQV